MVCQLMSVILCLGNAHFTSPMDTALFGAERDIGFER